MLFTETFLKKSINSNLILLSLRGCLKSIVYLFCKFLSLLQKNSEVKNKRKAVNPKMFSDSIFTNTIIEKFLYKFSRTLLLQLEKIDPKHQFVRNLTYYSSSTF